MMNRLCGIVIGLVLFFPSFSQDASRPVQPDFPGDLLIDWGLNTWAKKPANLPIRPWGSNAFSLYYMQRFRIIDHLGVHTGLGFTFDKYAFDDNFTWLSDANGTVSLDTLTGVNLTKNKLVVPYFEIPLELRIHPLGTVKGEGWFIGLGIVGGARLQPHTKVKYLINEEAYKEKVYGSFGINGFRYGLQARFGFKTFHLFYKIYPTDVFKSAPDASGKIPTAATFGMSFSGF